jgi:hypothetical protein
MAVGLPESCILMNNGCWYIANPKLPQFSTLVATERWSDLMPLMTGSYAGQVTNSRTPPCPGNYRKIPCLGA